MTRDEVLAMDPGRELDALVAEKVMGWEVNPQNPDYHIQYTDEHGNPYGMQMSEFEPSTDISAAVEALEAVKEKEQAHVEIELFYDSRIDGRVTIHDREEKEDIMLPFGKEQRAGFPKTLTEAICKAALLAVMES